MSNIIKIPVVLPPVFWSFTVDETLDHDTKCHCIYDAEKGLWYAGCTLCSVERLPEAIEYTRKLVEADKARYIRKRIRERK